MRMLIGGTLSFYLGRQFLFSFACTFLAILGVILLVDTAELLRDAAGKVGASFGTIVTIAFLRLPHLGQEAMPFAVLFGAMFAFVRLTRSHELVVARAAGVSAWQFLLPALVLTLAIGAAKVMLLNPFAAAMLERSNIMRIETVDGRSSLSAVSSSGLWLRQTDAAGDHAVVHAARVNPDDMLMRRVTIYQFHGADEFVRRIDAATAQLSNGYWELENGWVSGPSRPGERIESYRVPTDLTVERIVESFATPETVNFWQLPHFIAVLDATGLSSLPHRLHWHALLAEPVLLLAMVLMAATFSLRLSRRGGTPALVVSGVLAGFLLYLLTNVVHALGLGASLPVVLAAWTPAGVALTLGTAMVLHLEDG